MLSVVQNLKTGRVEVAELPAPIAKKGFVLVATKASVVSAGTERSAIELGRKTLAGKALARPDLVRQVMDKARRDGIAAAIAAVRSRLDAPAQLGYSSAGVVIEAGKGADEFAPGDRVACAGARYATHSEVVSVPKNLCVRIPDGVSFEDAAYVTLGAIAMHGVRQAGLALGETAAVVGCGLLGLLSVQILAAAGVKVFAIDIDEAKVELAKKLGAAAGGLSTAGDIARHVQDFSGDGADAVLVTAATKSSEPVRLAALFARDRGRVVVVGDVGLDIRRRPFYEKELTLVVSRSYGPGRYDPTYEEHGIEYPVGYVRWGERRNFAEFLSLVAAGKVRLDAITTHRIPIGEALSAYEMILGRAHAPYIGVVLTYAEEPATSRKVMLAAETARPADKVGVALVGAGAFATSVLLPALARVKNARGVAIVSAGGLSAQHAGKKYGFEYAATEFEKVLEDDKVNAVVIATRHNLHARQAAAALSAGRHVFVEKPLALDEEGLEEVRKAYAGAHKILMVGFNRRWSCHAAAAKGLFAGAAGPLTINYRVNAGSAAPGSWVSDGEEGGGRILGEVCHFIDLAAFLAGSLPASVFAVRPGGEAADGAVVTVKFRDGSVASIVYATSGEASFSKERVEAAGGGRTAVIEDWRRTTLYSGGARRTVRTFAQDKGHAAEMTVFFEAVKSGRQPVSFEELDAVTRATFAVEESLGTGRSVSLAD